MAARITAVAIGLLLGHAAATTLTSSTTQTASSIPCRTLLGTTSVALVPTSTVTSTSTAADPVVVTSTTLAMVTVSLTPTPVRQTQLETEYATETVTTTQSAVTDTFSTTSTVMDTTTQTLTPAVTTTTVVSSTSVRVTSTSTVATSSGFYPVIDTFSTGLPAAAKAKRSLPQLHDKRSSPQSASDLDCSPRLDDFQYAQAVECTVQVLAETTVIERVTNTLTTTATGSATPITLTITTTRTLTTTSTVLPTDVSTTLSFTTTATLTAITTAPTPTSTVTSTHTVATTSTAAVYAACATTNITPNPITSEYSASLAGKYVYFLSLYYDGSYSLSSGSTTSAYDCCVSCIENDLCANAYYDYVDADISYCYLVEVETCSFDSHYTYGVALK
ncbi:hypothetical protein BO70DRAFT_405380 [Aspergillus heteromorphus CBS 117.55]|uniref:Apple domain-containing protein n=1 Tax=Aspergillus heteromorphus CBS 117.55 TaxID=1448321 RepID=A0A317WD93_9EURO|nr:uncharacterized protein BO70DRAFT_405380 [Aspergillus heteromorphus CBS 117.55]PWY82140.1 hypothetical protein BO70DRAFT_405380 [Aspergillus heteromorphus CBS 117.55]